MSSYKTETLGTIKLINADCMDVMHDTPDKAFSLGIVDVPYSLSYANNPCRQNYKREDWDDKPPSREYFDELFRVCENAIIWGGNYFSLPPTQCFVFWYKRNPVENFADGEYAWTSFKRPALCFDYRYWGNIDKFGHLRVERIHPTEKPVQLYEWLLMKFAKKGDKILDTHGGSMSHALAAHNSGYDLTIIEKNAEYYEAAKKRLMQHQRQLNLFHYD